MSKETVSKLIEDDRVEFKSKIELSKLAEYYSMFSNTSPHGGILLIGVNDDATLCGCMRFSEQNINKLKESHRTHCIKAKPEFKNVQYNDEDEINFFVAIKIPYIGTLVETNKGEAFVRYGDSKHKMSEAEKQDYRDARPEITYELKPTVAKYPQDFDMNIIHNLHQNYCRREEVERGIEDVLLIRRLGELNESKEFVANNALVLLAAKDARKFITGCRIRIMRFEGTSEGYGETFNPIIDRFVEGNIVNLIEKSAEILNTAIYDVTYLDENTRFVNTKEYPKAAWFEALVNAAVHRSYSISGADIVIKLFYDRMIIESPGGFCPPVNADNIYEVRSSKNPFLMDAMYDLDYVKMAREGTRRMKESMKKTGLPTPSFSQETLNGLIVKVELRNNAEHRRKTTKVDVSEYYGATVSKTLSEEEKQILDIAIRNGDINVSEAQRVIGRTWDTCKKRLEKLKKKGLLDYVYDKKLTRDPNAKYIPKKVD